MSSSISDISPSVYGQSYGPSGQTFTALVAVLAGFRFAYVFDLPLQLTACLLLLVAALAKSELCGPALRVQLVLQLEGIQSNRAGHFKGDTFQREDRATVMHF